jgi:hypothetical protein
MVTISATVDVMFPDWNDINDVVEFLSYNHNVAVDLICESDFQCCKITNIEIKDERTDGATA